MAEELDSVIEALSSAKLSLSRLKPAPADYQALGAIFLPDNARFSRLLALLSTAVGIQAIAAE